AQTNKVFEKQAPANSIKVKESKKMLLNAQTYAIDLNALKQSLQPAPSRGSAKASSVVIAFPNETGKMEAFRIYEASVMDPVLQANYPDIRSYVGVGIDNPADVIRFSISPAGLQSMRLSPGKKATFIEPYTTDLSQYTVFSRDQKANPIDNFECEVTNAMNTSFANNQAMLK